MDNDVSPETDVELDTGLLGLVTLIRFHSLPADPDQLKHQFGRPGVKFDAEDLLRAAKRLKLKARIVKTSWSRLQSMTLPALAELSDGTFMVLGRIDTKSDQILIQSPGDSRVRILSREEFEAIWSSRLVLVTRRSSVFGKGLKFDISWFMTALVKYRKIFYEVLIASFFLQLFGLVSPLFFQVVVDKVLVHHGLTTLDVLMFGLFFISLFEVILGFLRTYIFSHTTNRVDVELGSRLFHHLLSLPLSYFQARPVGQSVARVRELENIRDFITGSALTLVVDLFFTIVFFVVMWYYSPLLTTIVLASIPFFVVLAVVVTPIFRARLEDKFQRNAENQAFLVESVTGVETLKALAVEPQMQLRWEEQIAGYVASSFKTHNLGNVAGQITQFISKITTVATLYFGALAVIKGELTVGQLVAFNMLAGRVTAPILRLSQLWNDFQQARISVERLGDILNCPTEPDYNPNRATPGQIRGDVSFDQVIFRYNPEGQEVLRRVTLEIPHGQVVGVVGSSGSGKSTLAKLIQRMYVPESGRVYVDGVDLSMIDTAWLRRQIGVVLQENILFNRSVRENISLADPGMPMERVIEAAKLAGAHEFILALNDGYDTTIGERGSNLSGGQRQRIAIARALVNNPRILIFDEATSALDYESEKIIQDNMRRICQGRTVVIIAHRLAAVREADRILTIEKGEIVEDGSHEELLHKKGRYSQLYQLQSGKASSEKGNDE